MTLKYEDYIEGTRRVLEASKTETEPYLTTVAGREFIVLPNVFSPKYFHDTEVFAEALPVREGEEMLEIGPGTGAISITAAYKGASRIIAIDINPDAVRNTELNIRKHGVQERIEVRLGDLYDAVRPGEKFDTIFWNTPFGELVADAQISDLEKAVYDPGYHATERFVKEAHMYLRPNGRLLIGFSSTLGRMEKLKQFVDEAGFTMRKIFATESVETHPVRFEIFEAI